MTLSPLGVGSARVHVYLDQAGHGFWPYNPGPSVYLPELPFRLLSTLAFYAPETLIPYGTLATVMYPDEVSDPYDGSHNKAIRAHLDRVLSLMEQKGWDRRVFEVRYATGVIVHARYFPRNTRIIWQ